MPSSSAAVVEPTHVRIHHDEFAKRALARWLKLYGEVRASERVPGETRTVDVYFVEGRRHRGWLDALGALPLVARGRVVFEPFRNAATEAELNSCFVKRIDLNRRDLRKARQKKHPASTVEETTLCVIVPSLSPGLVEALGAKPLRRAPRGFYAAVPILRTVVIVTGQLPKTRSTLLLRLLGRDRVRLEAYRELQALQEESGHKGGEQARLQGDTLELLAQWFDKLPKGEPLSADEQELRMSFEDWERKFKNEGKAEGKVEGVAASVVAVLEGRGIPLSATQRARVLACTDEATLNVWIRSAGTASSATALLSSAARRTKRPSARRPVMDAPLVARDSRSSGRR